MFSSPWHLLLFDLLGVTIIGTLTIIGGKAVYALRPVLKKNVFTLDIFYNVFIKSESQNLYSNMTF